MTDPESKPVIIQLNEASVLDSNGEIKHRYFHTTWFRKREPYGYIPVYLESYNKISKKFTIRVLTDQRVLDFIPPNYSLVPITEEQAQQMVDHLRSNTSKPQKPMPTELSNLDQAEAPAVAAESPAAPAEGTVATPAAEKPAKAKATRKAKDPTDTRPSIRSINLELLQKGVPIDEIVKVLQGHYPERDAKSLKSLISLAKNFLKKKNSGETAPATPAEGEAAPAAEPAATEAPAQ